MSALGEAQCKARLSPGARGAAQTQREGRVIVARHSFSDLGEGGLLGRKDRSFFAAGSRLRDMEVKSKGIKGKRVTQGRGGRSEKQDPNGPRVLRERERPERWPLSIAVFSQLPLAPGRGLRAGRFLSHNITIFISSTAQPSAKAGRAETSLESDPRGDLGSRRRRGGFQEVARRLPHT